MAPRSGATVAESEESVSDANLLDAEHDAQALLAEVERLRAEAEYVSDSLPEYLRGRDPANAILVLTQAVEARDLSLQLRVEESDRQRAEAERLREALRSVLPYALAFRPPTSHASTYAGFITAARAALEPTP